MKSNTRQLAEKQKLANTYKLERYTTIEIQRAMWRKWRRSYTNFVQTKYYILMTFLHDQDPCRIIHKDNHNPLDIYPFFVVVMNTKETQRSKLLFLRSAYTHRHLFLFYLIAFFYHIFSRLLQAVLLQHFPFRCNR